MSNTEIIIFSKNRTLQLKSLLLSLRAFSDIDEKCINIIYVESGGISYETLKKQFACKFIRQGIFLEDLRNIVSEMKAEYVTFMVDDLIFRDSFSFAKEEKVFEKHPELDAFSHRLGLNIQIGKMPEFIGIEEDVIAWDTSAELGKHWNYFWDVSSASYRKTHVAEYLSKCRVDKEFFPNPFEFHYYSCMPSTRASGLVKYINMLRYPFRKKSMRMACYKKSICFTQGVNLVAEINDVRAESFDIQTLHRKMEEGYVADYRILKDADVRAPNAGPEFFKLIKEKDLK